MLQAYQCGVPRQSNPAPQPTDVNIILFWGRMNSRDLYKAVMLDCLEVPDAVVEQRQELSFKEGERLIWPSSIRDIGKTSNGRYFAVHNMEEARAGPQPTEFYGVPAYGVFIASPKWDIISLNDYRKFLEWITRNNNTVLASVFHGNPGLVMDMDMGLKRLGDLIGLVKEMFPSSTLIAAGSTPTYLAGDRSFDEYTQLRQRWEWRVKEKCTTMINFGSAPTDKLFDQLVKEAVIKGDQRSMIGAFYPILREVLGYILCSQPFNGASLKDVALLMLQETLTIVTERYNDTNKPRLNPYVFKSSQMYRDFRLAIRRSRKQPVSKDQLYEKCAHDHIMQQGTINTVMDQYYRMGEELLTHYGTFSFEYRQRRIASLANIVKEAMVANEEPPALLRVDEELEVLPPPKEEMMDLFSDYNMLDLTLLSSVLAEEPAPEPIQQSVTDVVQEPAPEPIQQSVTDVVQEPTQQPAVAFTEEKKEEEKTFAILVPMPQEAYQQFSNEHQHWFCYPGQQQPSTTCAVHQEEQRSTPLTAPEEEQRSTSLADNDEEPAKMINEEEPAKMILRSTTKHRIADVEEEPKKKKLRRIL